MKQFLALLTIFCGSLYGQSIIAPASTVNGVPASNLITICSTNPGSGTCSSLVTTYTTIGLTTACSGTGGPLSGTGCSNPGNSDAAGNIIAFAASGQYWCQYKSSSTAIANSIPCSATGGGGGGAITGSSFTTTGANGGITGTEGTCALLTPATGIDLLCPSSVSGPLTSHGWIQNVNNAGWTQLGVNAAGAVGVLQASTGSGGLQAVAATDNGTNITTTEPIVVPTGTTANVPIQFSAAGATNSGIFFGSGFIQLVSGGTAKLFAGTNVQVNSTFCDAATGQSCFSINATPHLMNITGSNNALWGATNNKCTYALTTSTLTTAASPVSLCTFTLPAQASITWTWHCDAMYTVQAGTTPTFSVGETWAQAPASAYGESVIFTALNNTVQTSITTTTNSNIATTGTLTPPTTSFHVEWDGNFVGSGTSGNFSPTASVAGTSATGTLQGICTVI